MSSKPSARRRFEPSAGRVEHGNGDDLRFPCGRLVIESEYVLYVGGVGVSVGPPLNEAMAPATGKRLVIANSYSI